MFAINTVTRPTSIRSNHTLISKTVASIVKTIFNKEDGDSVYTTNLKYKFNLSNDEAYDLVKDLRNLGFDVSYNTSTRKNIIKFGSDNPYAVVGSLAHLIAEFAETIEANGGLNRPSFALDNEDDKHSMNETTADFIGQVVGSYLVDDKTVVEVDTADFGEIDTAFAIVQLADFGLFVERGEDGSLLVTVPGTSTYTINLDNVDDDNNDNNNFGNGSVPFDDEDMIDFHSESHENLVQDNSHTPEDTGGIPTCSACHNFFCDC